MSKTTILRNTTHISSTGRSYTINAAGIASPLPVGDYEDYGCECEYDWNCAKHSHLYTALERHNDARAQEETDIDRANGYY